jgi:MOSC domain-containing protein YiiM
MLASITAVSCSATHGFSKRNAATIRLLAGLGVEGDAHAGSTVKHRSRVARDPTQPNLRQVHLLQAELFDELHVAGFDVSPGQLGENITTRGLDLLALSAGTRLRLGTHALVELTGLRNPCTQLDGFAPGLMRALTPRGPDGAIVRKGGVMAIVLAGGEVAPGDAITIDHAPLPHVAMQVV